MKKTKLAVSKQRLLAAGGVLVCLAAAYITGSLAIDSASLWLYASTILLVIVSFKLIARAVGRSHESR